MGSTAAQTLLRKLAGEATPSILRVEPELIVRESTAAPAASYAKRRAS